MWYYILIMCIIIIQDISMCMRIHIQPQVIIVKKHIIALPCHYLFNSLLYCTRFTTYYYIIVCVQLGFTVEDSRQQGRAEGGRLVQLGTAAAPLSVQAVAEGPPDMGGNQRPLPEGDNQPEGGSQPVEDKRREHPPGAGSDKQYRDKEEEHCQER
jgi:hypothetical protein